MSSTNTLDLNASRVEQSQPQNLTITQDTALGADGAPRLTRKQRKAMARASAAQNDDPQQSSLHVKHQQKTIDKSSKGNASSQSLDIGAYLNADSIKGTPPVMYEMFVHLRPFLRFTSKDMNLGLGASDVHPAIVKLGLQLAAGRIPDPNERCLALIRAVVKFIGDYTTPPDKSLNRDLQAVFARQMQLIDMCYPQYFGMKHIERFLGIKIAQLSPSLSEDEAKAKLIRIIGRFATEKITGASSVIQDTAAGRIADDGDVVMVFGFTNSIMRMLQIAWSERKKRFRVIVVDARPLLRGHTMLAALVRSGIPCTYCTINSVCFAIKQVTKVFLGASAMLSNGVMFAPTGNAAVTLVAHSHCIPIIVCCETFKFSEQAKVDAITFNKLDDPELVVSNEVGDGSNVLAGWKELPHLDVLNLVYDNTPSQFITMVITEIGDIPATSINAVLREYRYDMLSSNA